ncbi:NUDIX domain-containing protein [Patescibacteria group bacterium]|nr:NUDIX domain-containing protein [Patescibacteria group bacterium]
MIKKLESGGLRPGIKALFYDPDRGETLLGTLPEGYPLRFNLPGGGIDADQTAAMALCREIEEELDISLYRPKMVMSLPVVAHGELPFKRDEFRGKYEFIIAVPHFSLGSIKALPDSKMLFWPAMAWQEALEKIRSLAYGGPEMVALYEKAFNRIPDLMYR